MPHMGSIGRSAMYRGINIGIRLCANRNHRGGLLASSTPSSSVAAARSGALRSLSSFTNFADPASTCGDKLSLRRSVLYMPASNDRALGKIATALADSFILDIEDAVAPAQKPLAREQAVAAAELYADPKYASKEIVIRVNGPTTEWHVDDVVAVAGSKADAMLLPKVESAEDVRKVEAAIAAAAGSSGNADMRIWCMIETPLGVLNAADIARVSPKVECLVMGTVDLANDLHCLPNAPRRWNMQFALNQVVCAARAYNKCVLDGVYVNLKDDEGFRMECRQGRDLGFDGKTLIHPKTISDANEAFSPTDGEVEHAKRIMQAHTDAVAEGAGCATLDNKLVEALHVRDALRVIKLAEYISSTK